MPEMKKVCVVVCNNVNFFCDNEALVALQREPRCFITGYSLLYNGILVALRLVSKWNVTGIPLRRNWRQSLSCRIFCHFSMQYVLFFLSFLNKTLI